MIIPPRSLHLSNEDVPNRYFRIQLFGGRTKQGKKFIVNRLTRCFRASWQRRRVGDNTRLNTRREGMKRTSVGSRFRARDKGRPINKTDHQEGSQPRFI